MKSNSTLRAFLALSGSALLVTSDAHAANIWDGGGGDNRWTTADNWDNNAVPTTAAVTFRGNTRNTVDNDRAATSVSNGFNFTNYGTAGFTNGFTLSSLGNSVTLGGNIVTTANTAGSTIINAIDHDLILSATRTIYTNQMSNTVQHNLTINGNISESVANSGITKTGYGTFILSGANSYTGATMIIGGTLVLDMAAGGSLNTATALSPGPNTTFGTFIVKGASTDSSAQTMGGTFYLGNNSALQILLDPNGGTGTTLTLGDAWDFRSNTVALIDYSSASTGTRQVVTANATTGVALADGIYGKVLVKDSNGVVGFATRAAGSNQAITRYDDTTGTTLGVASNSNTTNFTTLNSVYNSGTLDWTNGGALGTRSVNSLTIDTTNNGGTIDMGADGNTLNLDTAILFKGANNATLTGGRIGANNADVQIHQTGSGTLTINSLIGTGGGVITKNGTGTLVFGAENTYTGNTAINEGILKLGAAGNGTNTPLGTAGGGTRINSRGTLDLNGITLSTAEGLTLNGYGRLGGGALTNSASTAATWSGAITVQTPSSIIASGGDINLTNTTTTSIAQGLIIGGAKDTTISFALNGTVSNGSSARLIKQDSGTLNLAGTVASTYAGGTSVTGGALVFRNTASKSASVTHAFEAGTTLGLGVGSTGFFDSTDVTNAFSGTMTGNLSNVTVTATTNVGIDTNAGDFTHSADITGSPTKGLTKLGANKLTLSGTNSYTGETAIMAGTLALNANGSIANSSSIKVTTGTTFDVSAVTGGWSLGSGKSLGGDGTVTGPATFDNGSIFAWSLSVTTPANTGSATVADTLAVAGNLSDGDTAGGSVFKIVLAGSQTFADAFWTANHSWNDVLTSTNSLALETLFTSFSYENAGGAISAPTGGYSFTLSGSTLNYSPIPEPTTALAGLLLTAGLLRRRRK